LNLAKCAFANGWAVGGQGVILKTVDDGNTWILQNSGTSAGLTSTFFLDKEYGFVAGGGVVLKTTDGGTTWINTYSNGGALNSIFFLDYSTGYVAGSTGRIEMTANGGDTWIQLNSGVSSDLRSIVFINNSTGFAAGGQVILRTTDGGANWQIVDSSGSALNSIFFADANRGWAVGSTGRILATSDGGDTWSAQYSGVSADLQSVFFTGTNTGWAVGEQVILTTNDAGNTWVDRYPGGAALHSVSFYRTTLGLEGWAVGNTGAILKLVPGDTMWVPVASGAASTLEDVWFSADCGCGDPNCDGTTTIADVLDMTEYLCELTGVSWQPVFGGTNCVELQESIHDCTYIEPVRAEAVRQTCDFDNSGSIDTTDLRRIYQYMFCGDPSLCVPQCDSQSCDLVAQVILGALDGRITSYVLVTASGSASATQPVSLTLAVPPKAIALSQTTWTFTDDFSFAQDVPIEVHTYYGDSLTFSVSVSDRCCGAEDRATGFVNGSWDPNSKAVYPQGDGPEHIIHRDDTLLYSIDFQNTGTAPAFDIVIYDTLDGDLDLSSVVPGPSSHPNTFSVNGRELSWRFSDINLPDSTHNEPESHGFVSYFIRPTASVAEGAVITNRAAIVFDTNEPVLTNTVLNTIYKTPTESGTISGTIHTSGGTLTGVRTDLFDSENTLLSSQYSDGAGYYEYGDLVPGNYRIELIPPIGFVPASDPDTVLNVNGVSVIQDFELEQDSPDKLQNVWWWKVYLEDLRSDGPRDDQFTADDINTWGQVIFHHFYNRSDGHAIQVAGVTYAGNPVRAMSFSDVCYTMLDEDHSTYESMVRYNMLANLLNLTSSRMLQTRVVTADGATASQAITYFAQLYVENAGWHPGEFDKRNKLIMAYQGLRDMTTGTLIAAGVVPLTTPNVMYKAADAETPEELPTAFSLSQNYPNPFNPTTTISFELPVRDHVTLTVYNMLGQRMAVLVDDFLSAGAHTVEWDGRGSSGQAAATGVYLYRLEAGKTVKTKKMVLMK
jgi:uncharacterized repeat protein (TIGR01451 family)